jgi:hypothetical protein
MLPRKVIAISALLLSNGLTTQTAFAQLNPDSSQPASPGANLQRPGIVNECFTSSSNGVESICRHITPPKTKTVTIQVPEFEEGDKDTHVYIVSGVHQGGCSGSGTGHPDEYGLIEENVAYGPATDEDPCQYYLIVMDNKTLEARITLDLYEVKLVPFLASLETSISLGVRVATRSRSASSAASQLLKAIRQYPDQRISIRGDNLTLDEVLDRVYQDTGCIVNREAAGIALASCP